MKDQNETHYYRFPIGSVVLRKTGDVLEKFGKDRVWKDASDLSWRFYSDDQELTEITAEEAEELIKSRLRPE